MNQRPNASYYSARYAERKRDAERRRDERPEAIAPRLRRRAICEQVERERKERFPVVTTDNAAEAFAWQDARLRELTREAK